jgi:phenylalanyl-tRNA synthetase beta chain
VFAAPGARETLPTERTAVAALLTGVVPRAPIEPDRPVDMRDAADVVRALADALGVERVELDPDALPGYQPTRGARVLVGGVEVGRVGELERAPLRRVGLAPPVAAVELDFDALEALPRRDRAFRVPSPFPPSTVDLDFVVRETVTAGAVATTVRDALGPLIEDIRAFDEFRGEQLGAGRKSLAFTLRFRSGDHTLSQAEVAELRQRAIDAVTEIHQARLRGSR